MRRTLHFFDVFHFRFLLTIPIIFQEHIFKHFGKPPSRPQNAMKFMSRTPQKFCEIHPKFSYNHFWVIVWNPRRLIHTYLHPLQFCYTPVLAVLVALSNFHWTSEDIGPPFHHYVLFHLFISHILKLFLVLLLIGLISVMTIRNISKKI